MSERQLRVAVFYNNPYGGSGRIVYEYVRRLCEHHTVEVFTFSPPGTGLDRLEALDPQRPASFSGFRSPPRPFGRLYPLFMLKGLRTLATSYRRTAELINERFDVALVFPCIVTPAPMLLRYLRIPSVLLMGEPLRGYIEPPIPRPYYGHGRRLGSVSLWLDRYDPFRRLQERVFWQVDIANARCATQVLAYSYYSREMLYRVYGINPGVNYAGVDADVFRPPEVEQRENVVLSVGRVSPEKGHDFVLRAIALLPAAVRPVLIIAGDGGDQRERGYLDQLAEDLGVQLRFESSSHETDIVARYQRAKVVAFAPILEPFGFVPLEAMACGAPVVGVREGGVRETIRDGEGGFLMDREPAAMSCGIARLLSDESLWYEQSRRGRTYAEANWQWSVSAERLETHLRRIRACHD